MAYITPDGYKLGIWVSVQRRTRNKLPPERQSRLEALRGWIWNSLEDAWQTGFAHLSDYCASHGNCLVPHTYECSDGYKLGRWVSAQRTRRKEMPNERQFRFEALRGWTWNSLEDAWETGFAHLSDYSATNGNCLFPHTYVLPDGYKLGTWVAVQRRTRDKMPLERQSRFEALRGWTWKSHDGVWEVGFAHLRDYCATNGSCLVPQTYELPDGYKLGRWVNSQRTRRDTMPLERQSCLEALPGWSWSTKK